MLNLLRFFFELGRLKFIPRSGWQLLGIKYPESVAEHSLRAAQIGYFIAVAEGRPADPDRVCTRVVFHDRPESRSGDLDKLARRYVTDDERRIAHDQSRPLDTFGMTLDCLWAEWDEDMTPDAIIAHDADLVECAVQAKEYIDQGHSDADDWIRYAEQHVNTETAKELLAELRQVKATDWWKGLK